LKRLLQLLWNLAVLQLLQKLAESGITVVVVAHEQEKDLTWADKIIKDFK